MNDYQSTQFAIDYLFRIWLKSMRRGDVKKAKIFAVAHDDLIKESQELSRERPAVS